MQLNLSQVARLFGVSENTITGWVRNENLPATIVQSQYRFHRIELLEWSALTRNHCPPKLFRELNGDQVGELSLAEALEFGDILYDVSGDDKSAVLAAALTGLPLPPGFDRQQLLELVLARESLSHTCIGDGIAVPHPRYPVVLSLPIPAIRLCFLAKPIDFRASDQKPVDKLFIMICPTVHCHLQLLAMLASALRDKRFLAVLGARADRRVILQTAQELESSYQPLN